MEKEGDHGTDAASIKPVSSLLSHFEGLKTQKGEARAESPSRRPFESQPLLEAPRPTAPVRGSLDLPRPSSPWNGSPGHGQSVTRTPVNSLQRRMSPPASNHKSSLSMQMSTPQQMPLVKVESPRSPPHSFFQRSSSRSPERVDNTPFAKVRELVAQHSSRSSTRSNTPGFDPDALNTKSAGMSLVESARTSSPARQPPPVNRADKPKIPAKPLGIMQTITGSLTPEPQSRRPSAEAKVSPFSTPPSSAETSPSQSPPLDQPGGLNSSAYAGNPASIQSAISKISELDHDSSIEQPHRDVYEEPTIADPRSMGFASTRTTNERRDPRSLGFSGGSSASSYVEKPPIPLARTDTMAENSISRDARSFGFSTLSTKIITDDPIPSQPVRANTIVERQPIRDARDLGFSSSKSSSATSTALSKQAVPMRSLPPPVSVDQRSIAAPVPDSRRLGFTAVTAAVDKGDSAPPSLPSRRVAQEAPPRPSAMSKPAVKQSVINLNTALPEQASKVEPSSARELRTRATSDLQFPPPPKRHTFSEEDNIAYEPSIKPLQRVQTVAASNASQYLGEDLYAGEQNQTSNITRNEYPDATQANRRPPFALAGAYEISVRGDPRVFDVCGRYLCVSGYSTRVFDMETGEQIMSVGHGDTVKVTAVKFKPGASFEEEGLRLWLGNNIGDLQELDIATQTITGQSSAHNRREVTRILRYQRDLISMDDEGKLLVWKADHHGVPSLKSTPIVQKTQRVQTFSTIIHDKLWLASGKEVRILRPGNDAQFHVLSHPLSQSGAGDITSGAYTSAQGGRVYLGHTDGKVTIYSASDYAFLGTFKVSDYKINSLSFVKDKLWVAYKTGKVYVYDVSTTPWKVKKDWPAHAGPVHGLVLDPSSVWTLQRLHVVTVGHDNYVRMWDATLEEDWIETAMQERDVNYCAFRELKVAVITWNVGAIAPTAVRSDFIADAIHANNPPELVVVGLQEVVDLEDRAVTAKSLLGFAKKKEVAKTDQQQQHQSRVYREWRDYIARCLDRYTTSNYSYSEVHMSSLVGLFQCVFIRNDERKNVSLLSTTNIKCGMGGHYGNKGALVARFALDDSSLCFTNCHLAAGQSQTSHRNNDIATILESESLGVESNRQVRSSLFVGGGDGTQILDHEICILNGDLNYRIDTIPRDTVIKMIRNNELAKLLDRDQLLVSRRRVSGFRLSAFSELPIVFAPTYKYDPGTDNYDSSEKKRSPAWCDRVLYRGPGRIKQIEYRRHEVRVSDHRPVSGLFKIRVKKVNPEKRDKAMDECYRLFKSAKKEMAEDVCVQWLVEVMGLGEAEARKLIVG